MSEEFIKVDPEHHRVPSFMLMNDDGLKGYPVIIPTAPKKNSMPFVVPPNTPEHMLTPTPAPRALPRAWRFDYEEAVACESGRLFVVIEGVRAEVVDTIGAWPYLEEWCISVSIDEDATGRNVQAYFTWPSSVTENHLAAINALLFGQGNFKVISLHYFGEGADLGCGV